MALEGSPARRGPGTGVLRKLLRWELPPVAGIPACAWISHSGEALWGCQHPLGFTLLLEGLLNHWV